jgi:hypothetical protein
MKKTSVVALIASGFAAAVVGLAAPAQADIGHHDWAVGSNQQQSSVSSTNTTVQQSR